MRPLSAVILPVLSVGALLAGELDPRASARDWPMFGKDATHNGVVAEGKPPADWAAGEFDRQTGAWNREKSRNVKWVAKLGSTTFGDPVVADGLVWVGTNNWQTDNDKAEDASVLSCFRESDGKLLYRYVSPRLPQGRIHDWPFSSLSCSPLVEGDRIWFTTNRCETVFLDIGPLHRGEGDPQVIWKVDMMHELGVYPRGSIMTLAHFCSPAGYKDWLYVITGHGAEEGEQKVSKPEGPSLVCFAKQTGKVVWSDNSPGANILYGTWASPLVAEISGVAQVIAPLGDGWVRSFEAATGKLLWEFDINPKDAIWGGYRPDKRGLILATPVLYEHRLYITSGHHPMTGEGPGRLCCIDPTRRGDISSELVVDGAGSRVPHRRIKPVEQDRGEKVIPNPNSGLVWEFTGTGGKEFVDRLHGAVCNVAIKDGLLILPDFSGLVHCLDARTGQRYWACDGLASIYGSPLIIGNRIYVADEDGDVAIFGLSADPKVATRDEGTNSLAEINMGESVHCSPIFANGTLYIASKHHLFAIAQETPPPAAAKTTAGHWPQWRGPERDNVATETGLLREWPANGPPLVWQANQIGEGIASVAIDKGSVYTLGSAGDDEHVIALQELTGELRWLARIGPAISDAPLMRWLSQRTPTVDDDRLYASTAQGDLICLATANGQELWRKNYRTDFGSTGRTWGFVDRPLVDGEHLICTTGGPEATVAALDKRSGQVIWKCAVQGATGSYSSPIVTTAGGVRHYVAFLSTGLVGVRAHDGKLLWRYEGHVDRTANGHTPLAVDDFLISPNGRNAGIAVLRLTPAGEGVAAQEILLAHPNLDMFQDSSVRLGDHLYASGTNGLPVCVNWRTGKMAWGPVRTPGRGRLALTYADQRLYLLYADGTLLLTEATPEAYRECDKFVLEGHQPSTGATFPVVAGGRLFVRDNDRLFCYDVRQGVEKPAESHVVDLRLAAARLPTNRPRFVPKTASPPPAKNKQPDAIFVPTPHDVVAKMLELAGVTKADLVYDLGSGDGRIVIAAGKKYGSKAVGFELDRSLLEQSQENVQRAKVGELVQIHRGDLFAQDLAAADVIALYLPPKLMDRLLPQLEKLKPGARVVSHYFKFTDVPPEKSLRFDSGDDGDVHDIHLWTAPLRKPSPP